MQPEARRRLGHVVDAGETILRITAEKTFDDYEADEILRLAVERLFMIVGEALREAARADEIVGKNVADSRKVVDFRNVIVHD